MNQMNDEIIAIATTEKERALIVESLLILRRDLQTSGVAFDFLKYCTKTARQEGVDDDLCILNHLIVRIRDISTKGEADE